MIIAFLISLVAAYLLPATPAATTCGHWLDAQQRAIASGRWK
jgi:hypothetical protein